MQQPWRGGTEHQERLTAARVLLGVEWERSPDTQPPASEWGFPAGPEQVHQLGGGSWPHPKQGCAVPSVS